MIGERHQFASDNTAPICPEVWVALQEANTDYAAAYGEDRWTARVCDRIREIFETDCDVYLVFTGTAANALAPMRRNHVQIGDASRPTDLGLHGLNRGHLHQHRDDKAHELARGLGHQDHSPGVCDFGKRLG